MTDTKTIKRAFERIRELVKKNTEIGIKTINTKVILKKGTTCEVVHKNWSFKVDIGKAEGGNNAGPGPGLLQRGALGGCLVIGYVQQAAVMGVPINHIEVEIEADKDLRGRFNIDNSPPGSLQLKYNIKIESPAPEADIQKVIEEADRLSPVLDDFRRAVPIKRSLNIHKTKQKKMGEAEQ